MENGIPREAVGLMAGALLYSIICFLASTGLVLLLWRQGDRRSYVFTIVVVVSISTLASIIQQIDYAIEWRRIVEARFEKARHIDTDAGLRVAGTALPSQVVLFWIQYYSYNVNALLIMFWSVALFCGTWDISARWIGNWQTSAAPFAEVFAIVAPAVPIGIVQAHLVRKDTVLFLVLANILLMTTLSTGIVTLILSLFKYLEKRRQYSSFRSSERARPESQAAARREEKRKHRDEQWLIIRFTIAFVLLGAYEMFSIIFQFYSHRSNTAASKATVPNYSMSQVRTDLLFFIPGVTQSLAAWLIFGTTATFRREYSYFFWRMISVCTRRRAMSRSSSIGQGTASDVELVRDQPFLKGDMIFVPARSMSRSTGEISPTSFKLHDLSGYLKPS